MSKKRTEVQPSKQALPPIVVAPVTSVPAVPVASLPPIEPTVVILPTADGADTVIGGDDSGDTLSGGDGSDTTDGVVAEIATATQSGTDDAIDGDTQPPASAQTTDDTIIGQAGADTQDTPTAPEPVGELEPEQDPTVYTFLAGLYPALAGRIDPEVAGIFARMEAYINDMDPGKPMSEKTGGQYQRALYFIYLSVLDLEHGRHKLALDGILWYINKHRAGVFSERMVFRFMDTVKFNKKEAGTFQQLTNLFITTCNPVTRSTQLKKIRIRLVADTVPSLKYAERLISYYT